MLTHLHSTNFKLALKSALYDFTSAKDFYREVATASGIGMHRDLILRYVELQALLISPIAPHWAEHMWLDVLKKVFDLYLLAFDHLSNLTNATIDGLYPKCSLCRRSRACPWPVSSPCLYPFHNLEHYFFGSSFH